MTSSEVWSAETAERYDDEDRGMFAPEVLEPTIELLAELAGEGPALELAIGTGRVGVPLRERGVPVVGIELSEPMAARLRAKVDEATLPVTIGDMATSVVDGAGSFALVYLVYNTISNLRTQDEQVECFVNAARHLSPGGRFVIEVGVPPLRRLPPTQSAVPFDVGDEHVGFDTFDLATQQSTSHHFTRQADGTWRRDAGSFRFTWPTELDLMARIAGLQLEARYGDWDRRPFTDESTKHVSVWRKPG
ncbi:class I SAM-dependent methyltransferase [Nocardioides sp. HM23]|uniref:class I SAM-dependent DNA methyltransferase n=1 Tax=Nocardioides bizhenqiangii TaxID=3095076 RepID=UPI002ACA958E|nr:class I SAM-dependent methyltransferase [Nocardioides sp. HM23]MDZ5622269.1 class I SAM-dependent methyltransferase [Nocardioides sp. HM23]